MEEDVVYSMAEEIERVLVLLVRVDVLIVN